MNIKFLVSDISQVEIFNKNPQELSGQDEFIKQEDKICRYFSALCFVHFKEFDEAKRKKFILKLLQKVGKHNMHPEALSMPTVYKNEIVKIEDSLVENNNYKNLVILPLHTLLTDEEVFCIIQKT